MHIATYSPSRFSFALLKTSYLLYVPLMFGFGAIILRSLFFLLLLQYNVILFFVLFGKCKSQWFSIMRSNDTLTSTHFIFKFYRCWISMQMKCWQQWSNHHASDYFWIWFEIARKVRENSKISQKLWFYIIHIKLIEMEIETRKLPSQNSH